MTQTITSRFRWSDFEDFIEKQPIEDQLNPNVTYDVRTSIYTQDNKKVKKTEYVKITTLEVDLPKSVIERKERLLNNKFGLAKSEKQQNDDNNVTSYGESVDIKKILNTVSKEENLPNLVDKTNNNNISCRKCGGPHWTSSCTESTNNISNKDNRGIGTNGNVNSTSNSISNSISTSADTGKYVPPSRRAKTAYGNDEHEYKLRLSNLSEDTSEDDLYDLVSIYGSVAKINIIRDYNRVSRGFAFVMFHKKESVSLAVEKLNGLPHKHLILQAELALPRTT